jgi:hypothetical protein
LGDVERVGTVETEPVSVAALKEADGVRRGLREAGKVGAETLLFFFVCTSRR